MRYFTSAFLLAFFLLGLARCKKEEKKEADAINIVGFTLFDQFGNNMGRVGPVDMDWQFVDWSTLSPVEQLLLNLADTATLTNTNVSAVSLQPFPNPVLDESRLLVNASDSARFKLVITDKTGTVLKQMSRTIKGSTVISLDLSDRNLYPIGKSLRYYYSFSAQGSRHFKLGYGDIKVCSYSSGQNPATVCF
jgi:hypothetical protein